MEVTYIRKAYKNGRLIKSDIVKADDNKIIEVNGKNRIKDIIEEWNSVGGSLGPVKWSYELVKEEKQAKKTIYERFLEVLNKKV